MSKRGDKKALEHLYKDPVLKRVIPSLDAPKPIVSDGVYQDLTRAIVYQQISTKAADNIYGRYLELMAFDVHNTEFPLQFSIDELRSVGLSKQKAGYIQNIAGFFTEEKIKENYWEDKSDEAIINYLTQIKGVGVWTVQMILIFSLGRPDVFPIDDLAVRKAMQAVYGLKSEKKVLRKELTSIAEKWMPYRSLASRYMWAWMRANR